MGSYTNNKRAREFLIFLRDHFCILKYAVPEEVGRKLIFTIYVECARLENRSLWLSHTWTGLSIKVLVAQAVSSKESRLPMKLRLGYFHIRLLLSCIRQTDLLRGEEQSLGHVAEKNLFFSQHSCIDTHRPPAPLLCQSLMATPELHFSKLPQNLLGSVPWLAPTSLGLSRFEDSHGDAGVTFPIKDVIHLYWRHSPLQSSVQQHWRVTCIKQAPQEGEWGLYSGPFEFPMSMGLVYF